MMVIYCNGSTKLKQMNKFCHKYLIIWFSLVYYIFNHNCLKTFFSLPYLLLDDLLTDVLTVIPNKSVTTLVNIPTVCFVRKRMFVCSHSCDAPQWESGLVGCCLTVWRQVICGYLDDSLAAYNYMYSHIPIIGASYWFLEWKSLERISWLSYLCPSAFQPGNNPILRLLLPKEPCRFQAVPLLKVCQCEQLLG